MHTLLHRKVALFTIVAIYTGFCSVFLCGILRQVLLCVLAVLCICSFLIRAKKFSGDVRTFTRLILCALLTGSLLFSLYTDIHMGRNLRRYADSEHTVTATVVDTVYVTSYSAAYVADITECDGNPVRFRVLLETPTASLRIGNRICCRASFTEPEETDGTFPLRRYYVSRGISLCAESESVTLTDTNGAPLRRFFADTREYLSAALQILLGRETAPLPAALLLGDRTDLSDAFVRDFQRLGISHLLAISGFHFAALLGVTEKLLTAFIPNRKIRLIPLSTAAVLYMFLCGLSPSVLRAGCMMLFAYTAVAFNRKADMPTSLGVSLFLICLFDPAQFYSAALHLSATAVLGIACYDHIVRIYKKEDAHSGKLHLLWKITAPLFMALCVQLALIPFLCLYFGELSLLTPLTTVIFSPLITLILLLTPALLLFRYVPFLAKPLVLVLRFLCRITVDLSGELAQIPDTVLPLHLNIAPYFAIAVMAVFFTIPLLKRRKQIVCAFAVIATLCGSFCGILAVRQLLLRDHVTVTATVRGTNEGILIGENGRFLLCDLSNGSYSAINSVYSRARAEGAVELDALLLTHLHKRHTQTFDRLSDTAYVRMLILPHPGNEAEAEIADSLNKIAEKKNIPVRTYTRGETGIGFCDVTIRPDTAVIRRSTHPVIAVSVSAHGKEIAYVGASASEGLDTRDLRRYDAVIFGIHGPIYKSEWDTVLSDTPICLVFRGNAAEFASENVNDQMDTHLTVRSDDPFRIRLSPVSSENP